tara:strand:+ start:610 stop:972 length:363 start_codon:yes stop_codon:yes gene_type:complete
MKISILTIFGGCTLLLSLPTLAQSQQEMNSQARESFKMADAELNAVYKKVIALLPDEKAITLLRKAQRAWVIFRDADAASHADAMRDGSAAPLLFYGQQTQLTRSRIKNLQRYLKDFGER